MNRTTAAISAVACLGGLSWSGPAPQAQLSTAAPGSPQWFFDVTAEAPAGARSIEHQRYTQSLVAAGREDRLAGLSGRFTQAAECALQDAAGSDIVAELAALARSTRIVIINEAHDMPRHRELTRRLAIALRDQGYGYFAAEAFSPQAHRRPDENFGRSDAGNVSEPAFGNLLRTVKQLGYHLVPYEHTQTATAPGADAAAIAARENGQAANLVARVFAIEPGARVIVHSRYSHAAETAMATLDGPMPTMAMLLKARTDIDPLTIDQTYCVSPTVNAELARSPVHVPDGAFDVMVAHPQTTFFRGRPQWRIDAGAIAIEFPPTLIDAERRTLLEARFENEPPDTIPVDRLLLWPGESMPLLLPTGRIRLTQHFDGGAPPRSLVISVQ